VLLVLLHGHHRRVWLLAKVTAMVLVIVLIKAGGAPAWPAEGQHAVAKLKGAAWKR